MNYIKICLYIFIGIFLFGCSGPKEKESSKENFDYKEGTVLHFSWKEQRDSHEIILAANQDTTFHSKAWRILGYHRSFYEVPCEINGIYSPDSGFQFSLFDSKYNESGIGHLYMNSDQEWELEINRNGKSGIHHLNILKNFQDIHLKMLYQEDCSLAEKFKKNPKLISNQFDTLCSKSQIFYPQFEPGNPLQSLVFNEDSFSLLPGKELYYRDIYGSFFPLFSNEKYISFYATSYIFTGGAHGTPATELISIDKSSNQILNYTDIMDTSQSQSLNQVCEPFFKDQVGLISEWNFVKTGFFAPQQIILLKQGLLFQYSIYEIGSYAQGMPRFFVPWSVLKPFLKPGFRVP